MKNKKSLVDIYGLGGTISMVSTNGEGAKPGVTIDKLVEQTKIEEIANVRFEQFRYTSSSQLCFNDFIELSEKIKHSDADAAVIVQGTDTLEECAFVMQCLQSHFKKPVVFVGAMRSTSMLSSDALLNLENAVRIAANPCARDFGVMIATGYEILSAWHTQKVNTVATQAFYSDKGCLAWIVEDRVQINSRPVLPRVELNFKAITDKVKQRLPEVVVVKITLDSDPRFLQAIVDARPDGLVIEAMGGGHVEPKFIPVLSQALKTMPAILASRCAFGEVLTHTYGYSGSEIELIELGLIPASWLHSLKCRILLRLLLANNADSSQIKQQFENFYQSV